MTRLARACALLEIPVDPVRLYYGDDPWFELWLFDVVDQVSAENRRQAEKMKRKR